VGGLLGGMEQRIGLFQYYGNKRLTVIEINKNLWLFCIQNIPYFGKLDKTISRIFDKIAAAEEEN